MSQPGHPFNQDGSGPPNKRARIQADQSEPVNPNNPSNQLDPTMNPLDNLFSGGDNNSLDLPPNDLIGQGKFKNTFSLDFQTFSHALPKFSHDQDLTTKLNYWFLFEPSAFRILNIPNHE